MNASIQEVEKKKGTPSKRPGPFGPAKDLLPQGCQPIFISRDTTVPVALELLQGDGVLTDEYDLDASGRESPKSTSKLPPEAQRVVLVRDDSGKVIGVFTWKSFGRFMGEIHTLGKDLSTLNVSATDLEKPRFIDPDEYVDTAVNWREFDYVLVGSAQRVIGVLTVSDVLGRLNDFAEAFVLISEIEHSIRDLIKEIYSEEELAGLLESFSTKTGDLEEYASKGLETVLEGTKPKLEADWQIRAIRQAIKVFKKSSGNRNVTSIKDLSFSQYTEAICNRDNWPRFEPFFQSERDIMQIKFSKINDLRNIVFHFRRGIKAIDTDKLRRFRNMLSANHELYHAKNANLIVEG
jgi:CBS domain-containing protein